MLQKRTRAAQVHNVGLHPSVVREESKLVEGETLNNIARLVGSFLEQREPGLQVSGHQVSHHHEESLPMTSGHHQQVDKSRTHIGDLAAIVRAVKGSRKPQLATPSPASLLSQLTGVCDHEEEELLLGKPQHPTRRLVEEIPKGGRNKEAGFAANLRKAFGPGSKDSGKEEQVKIRHNEIFLTAVQTRRMK